VFAQKARDDDAPGGYVVPHTAITCLSAPGGRCLAHFTDALDAATLAGRIATHCPA